MVHLKKGHREELFFSLSQRGHREKGHRGQNVIGLYRLEMPIEVPLKKKVRSPGALFLHQVILKGVTGDRYLYRLL